MNWVSGLVLYVIIWWVVLFVVLPIGTHAVEQPDETSGWRGAPASPRLWRKAGWTTLAACVVWLLAFGLIESGWVSFRDGIFAAPKD